MCLSRLRSPTTDQSLQAEGPGKPFSWLNPSPKSQNWRRRWYNFQSQRKSLKIQGAAGESLESKGRRTWSSDVQGQETKALELQETERKQICLYFVFFIWDSNQLEWCLSSLRTALPHSVHWFTHQSPLETFSETQPYITHYQLPRHPLIRSTWHIEWTITDILYKIHENMELCYFHTEQISV